MPLTPRVHRVLGLSLALPLALWMATGLLFHVKHRYAEAYETLRALASGPIDLSRFTVSAAQAVAAGAFDPGCVPRFALRPDGRGAWFGRKDGQGVAAVRASVNAARYGALAGTSASRDPPWTAVNIAIVLVAMPLVLGLALSGLRMALRRGRMGA